VIVIHVSLAARATVHVQVCAVCTWNSRLFSPPPGTDAVDGRLYTHEPPPPPPPPPRRCDTTLSSAAP